MTTRGHRRIVLPVLANRAPRPGTINYSSLSPQSKEVLAEVGLRLTAGWLASEIVQEFNRRPPPFRHVERPRQGTFTTSWLNTNMRRLRDEMVASVDD